MGYGKNLEDNVDRYDQDLSDFLKKDEEDGKKMWPNFVSLLLFEYVMWYAVVAVVVVVMVVDDADVVDTVHGVVADGVYADACGFA